ncbi:hypothetical protein EWM64_g1278 [Hericium alpestre]|uniref:Chromatin target of PRMT1 protein C-terminal domain-containing protein n=1 Tax=Hericium alpestre TaxID=135208 RepID=A0A4Z0A7M0_9AGAM|nr:hypothetical protein EWM64_g1278 [Hericium alpestre]
MAPFNRRTQLATQAPDGAWLHDKAPPSGPRRDTASAVHAGPTTNKLVVSNLHYEVTPKDLMAIFGQIGTLVREPLIRKPPLIERLGRAEGEAKTALVKNTRSVAVARARGKGARGAAAPAPRPARAKPKTAAELDTELDAFMGAPPAGAKTTETQVQNGGSAQEGDVEMQ